MDQGQCRAQLKIEHAGTPPMTVTVEGTGNACLEALGIKPSAQGTSTGNNSGSAGSNRAPASKFQPKSYHMPSN